jgi:hypothetical protein
MLIMPLIKLWGARALQGFSKESGDLAVVHNFSDGPVYLKQPNRSLMTCRAIVVHEHIASNKDQSLHVDLLSLLTGTQINRTTLWEYSPQNAVTCFFGHPH